MIKGVSHIGIAVNNLEGFLRKSSLKKAQNPNGLVRYVSLSSLSEIHILSCLNQPLQRVSLKNLLKRGAKEYTISPLRSIILKRS